MKQKIKDFIELILLFFKYILDKIKKNKKLRIILIILTIIIIAFIAVNFYRKKKLEMEKNTDVTNSIHAIVMEDFTGIFKKPKDSSFQMFNVLEKGTNAYILDEVTDSKDMKWYKVKCKDRIGYIKKENLKYFEESNEEKVLMSDVSKFNVIYKHFKTTEDYEIFLLKNNIQYVYIRAGGRGYGEEGNFYEDPNYQIFIDACEYLKIPYGFYYIDEATNSKEVDEEIDFVEKFINENKTSMCKLPLAIDIEEHDGKGRADKMWENRAYIAEELVQKFKIRCISTIIYTNAKTGNEFLSNVNVPFWVAYYPKLSKIPNYWYSDTEQEATENIDYMNKIIGWQFTESGVENIIKEKVDISLVNNDFFKQYIK